MLPENHEPYIDKYFLRANQILKAEGLNPFVRAQVFIRKGPGKVYGIDEALEIIDKYSDLGKNGGRVFSLREGSEYDPKETLMVIEARVQDIIELETMYLGVLAAETTKANDHYDVDPEKVRENMRAVVDAAQGKPVSYFGARHWRYDMDAEIARAAYEGGAESCSTDIGAATFGQKGMGTIPHALENVYAWKYGYRCAVKQSTLAFDRVIEKEVPRIALIDYANKEIEDSLATATALEGRLFGARVDTCGENIAEGAREGERKYWNGNGVTISGVYALRMALDEYKHEDMKIFLSSGFGNVEKVKAFVEAEKELELKLFDALGVGGVYDARMSTMDIVAVGEDRENMQDMAKIGREYKANERLELRIGDQND